MLTIDSARTLITTSMADADLADAIAREEAWLARRIGPLQGERTETFIIGAGDEVLELTRPAIALGVEDESGIVTEFAYRGWSDLIRTAGAWAGPVLVTYDADDAAEVKRALITLLRLSVNESAYAAQSAQGYSSAVDTQALRTVRWATWRSLLRPQSPSTLRIHSAIPSGNATIRAVGTS